MATYTKTQILRSAIKTNIFRKSGDTAALRIPTPTKAWESVKNDFANLQQIFPTMVRVGKTVDKLFINNLDTLIQEANNHLWELEPQDLSNSDFQVHVASTSRALTLLNNII